MINLAWDHNSYYQPRLLRALPARCERVLDVGCGKGEFAIRLAERAGRCLLYTSPSPRDS